MGQSVQKIVCELICMMISGRSGVTQSYIYVNIARTQIWILDSEILALKEGKVEFEIMKIKK